MRLLRMVALVAASVVWAAAPCAAEDVASLQGAFLRGEYERVAREASRLRGRAGGDRDALLYLEGVSSWKLGRWVEARGTLTDLVERYPSSRWAPYGRLALERLNKARARGQLGQRPDAQEADAGFTVQVGAFVNRANAGRLAEELRRRGYPAEVREGAMDGKGFYRVRVGSFARRTEAEEKAGQMQREGFPARVVP